MKALIFTALFTLAPSVVRSTACKADNVLRALRANSAKASPFCSTYTRPPPNQPLPTYVSQYPASRVSSGCSCLITTTSSITTTLKTSTIATTTTPSTPSPTDPPDYVCEGEVLRNGNFQTLVKGKPEPWIFAPETHNNGQSTYAGTGSSGGNTYAYLTVDNGNAAGGPGRPYFKQIIPGLCGNTYTLNYTSSLFIRDGQPYHFCRAFIDLDDQQLVFIGGPNGDIPPWQTQTRSYTFTYTGTGGPNALTVAFDCATASWGSYRIDDISLVGAGEGN